VGLPARGLTGVAGPAARDVRGPALVGGVDGAGEVAEVDTEFGGDLGHVGVPTAVGVLADLPLTAGTVGLLHDRRDGGHALAVFAGHVDLVALCLAEDADAEGQVVDVAEPRLAGRTLLRVGPVADHEDVLRTGDRHDGRLLVVARRVGGELALVAVLDVAGVHDVLLGADDPRPARVRLGEAEIRAEEIGAPPEDGLDDFVQIADDHEVRVGLDLAGEAQAGVGLLDPLDSPDEGDVLDVAAFLEEAEVAVVLEEVGPRTAAGQVAGRQLQGRIRHCGHAPFLFSTKLYRAFCQVTVRSIP
jgi:hypothetical protein